MAQIWKWRHEQLGDPHDRAYAYREQRDAALDLLDELVNRYWPSKSSTPVVDARIFLEGLRAKPEQGAREHGDYEHTVADNLRDRIQELEQRLELLTSQLERFTEIYDGHSHDLEMGPVHTCDQAAL